MKLGAHLSGSLVTSGVFQNISGTGGSGVPPLQQFVQVPQASTFAELGLAEEKVYIRPDYRHRQLIQNDFGPDIPAELHWMLAAVDIQFTLIHYDKNVLDYCMSESMGGTINLGGVQQFAGILQPAGVTLGRGLFPQESGCHYISVNILSPQLAFPWRFRTTYLNIQPVEIPLGTERSAVMCNFRAIPYIPLETVFSQQGTPQLDAVSSGIVLWDHQLDVT